MFADLKRTGTSAETNGGGAVAVTIYRLSNQAADVFAEQPEFTMGIQIRFLGNELVLGVQSRHLVNRI